MSCAFVFERRHGNKTVESDAMMFVWNRASIA